MSTPVENSPRRPPYKLAGLVFVVVVATVLSLIWLQFRGELTPKTTLTLLADRSGLVMDPGSKVTYNGIEIGRVTSVALIDVGDTQQARITTEVDPKLAATIPANVDATINATTVFGNKYVAFASPKGPPAGRVSTDRPIRVTSATTEFNTLFETVVGIAEQVDPVKLNATLTAAAVALDGFGNRFGRSLEDANVILDDLNPRIPQLRKDIRGLADLTGVYADASPDLWAALENAVTTARTVNEQQANLDAALMASIGIANVGAETFDRSAPYFIRTAADLIPTSQVLHEYSPMIYCTTRNYALVAPKVKDILGGDNGYSLASAGTLTFPGNPYIWPDNLPRINARGGPEGKPGCWQNITHDLWPAPYLVMDTGYSMAPYNHFELGQPIAVDFVWGRQIGELTINP